MNLPMPFRPETIHALLPTFSSFLTWKTLALVLALINLKNLPLAWHLRILHHLWWNLRRKPQDPHFPKAKSNPNIKHSPQPHKTHPIFTPYSITSRTPILETDYNFHKSNSTYFTDLDISRTALVTRLYTPGLSIVSKELDVELLATSASPEAKGKGKGKGANIPKTMYVALGSVYCGFKREIKPFVRYEVESRVVGWDQKWLYVLSFFLGCAKGKKKGERVLFAAALGKYVVKKGRVTVLPERVLRASGFLPGRPSEESRMESSFVDVSGVGTPAGEEGIAATAGVDGALVREVLKIGEGEIPEERELEAEKKANAEEWDGGEWAWEMIEEERLRGLKVVQGYVDLDAKLYAEWER